MRQNKHTTALLMKELNLTHERVRLELLEVFEKSKKWEGYDLEEINKSIKELESLKVV